MTRTSVCGGWRTLSSSDCSFSLKFGWGRVAPVPRLWGPGRPRTSSIRLQKHRAAFRGGLAGGPGAGVAVRTTTEDGCPRSLVRRGGRGLGALICHSWDTGRLQGLGLPKMSIAAERISHYACGSDPARP